MDLEVRHNLINDVNELVNATVAVSDVRFTSYGGAGDSRRKFPLGFHALTAERHQHDAGHDQPRRAFRARALPMPCRLPVCWKQM